MRRFTALLATAAIVTLSGPLAAQPAQQRDTVNTSLPTQLPREAVPHHYAITVTPNAGKLTFTGNVAIDLEMVKASRTLTLNAADMTFGKVTITPAGRGSFPAAAKVDAKSETVTFDFGRVLQPGAYKLDIAYTGKINTQANGLFALDYKDSAGKDARALFTQFEAADARRFIPSWDEPDYKATFALTARIPQAQMAVSNMPAADTSNVAGGLKEVRFQPSPVMSSYLLFLATGDLERITKMAGNTEVGVVATRGNVEKARYALDAEAQILPYYNEYFGTPYPLPKLDNVAGPGQSQFFGAMENWGAIFTFERILLLDPAITTEAERQGIFSVEAHEMAHQWFGDLVTMGWWGDLWLNEGFASWMENRTTQHFHPEWSADVDSVGSREAAMQLDSFKSTHPIVQDVRTVEQANQAFDVITYQKGESVISMLEGFATPTVWRAGIRDYVKKHAYQNTTTNDLWSAVEGAGAKGLSQIARDFTNQPGIPLIRVGSSQCVNGQTSVTYSQSEFSKDRRAETDARPLNWHVPLRATAGGQVAQTITSGRTGTFNVPGCGPLLVNAGQTGYFRTLYSPAQAQALQGAFASLTAPDQFGLIADNLELSETGYQPMATSLDFLAATQPNFNPKVVQTAIGSWSGLYDAMAGNEAARVSIAARVTKTYGPLLQQVGFVPRQGEQPTVALLRPTLIATLGKFGDRSVAAESKRLFAAWQTDPNAIPGSLKSTWLRAIARDATPAEWDALHAKAKSATSAVERQTLYSLLGRTRDEALARRALDLALTDEPGKTVSAGMITAVAGDHPRMAVDFVLAHLSQVNQLVDISGRSRFLQGLAQGSGDMTLIPTLETYAKANLSETDRAPINRAIDRIRYDAAKNRRTAPEIAAWLQAHPA